MFFPFVFEFLVLLFAVAQLLLVFLEFSFNLHYFLVILHLLTANLLHKILSLIIVLTSSHPLILRSKLEILLIIILKNHYRSFRKIYLRGGFFTSILCRLGSFSFSSESLVYCGSFWPYSFLALLPCSGFREP